MKKLICLIGVTSLVLVSVNALAGGASSSQPSKESIFQTWADGINKMGAESTAGDKKSATCLFQKSYDQIEKTAPEKSDSLRGNPDELARRRGTR